jgi:hypothetical protein
VNAIRSLSVEHPGIARVLTSTVDISAAFDPSMAQSHPPHHRYRAIWDTGATGSVINDNVVKDCKLVQTGVAQVSHAQGKSQNVPSYHVNIRLPTGVEFEVVRVVRGDVTGGDVLIGMDIIASGDFVVTNYKGKTLMSFRTPSCERIDFVHPIPTVAPSKEKVHRNSPCPCGSKKKYKHCCRDKDMAAAPAATPN